MTSTTQTHMLKTFARKYERLIQNLIFMVSQMLFANPPLSPYM